MRPTLSVEKAPLCGMSAWMKYAVKDEDDRTDGRPVTCTKRKAHCECCVVYDSTSPVPAHVYCEFIMQ